MAEREYYCVDCGRAHVAFLWYVRQATLVGPLLKTDYLCGDATSASAEWMWVLWVEAPASSDQWSLAPIAEPRFKAEEDCQRRAQDLNDLEVTMAKGERWGGEAQPAISSVAYRMSSIHERRRHYPVDRRGSEHGAGMIAAIYGAAARRGAVLGNPGKEDAMRTITFGILGDVIFEMVVAGAPLPPGVHAPPNRLDATFAITCTEEEAQAMEAWLSRHQEKAEYRAAADLIQRVLRESRDR